MAIKILILFLVVTTYGMPNFTFARETPTEPEREYELKARLETYGSLVECWKALGEIRSCSQEIVNFFTNGTPDIGPKCCQAISTITHSCWPAMMTALGFTTDETYVLRGYCDASVAPADGPAV